MQRKRASCMDKIHYGAFKELFKALGVNPVEFKKLSTGKVEGHFPDMPSRTPTVDVKELARVIWNEPKPRKWGLRRT